MRKRRLLLLGASGYLGTQLWTAFSQDPKWEIRGTCFKSAKKPEWLSLDVTEEEKLSSLLQQFSPDEIIWALMSGEEEQRLIDRGLGALLSGITARTRLTFLSTDGIFAQGTGAFTEEETGMLLEKNNPLSAYANAKLRAEERIRELHKNHIIVRFGPIYGKNSNGLWDKRMSAMMQQLGEGKEMVRTSNLYKSFIHVEDLAAALHELVDSEYTGTIHLGPSEKESYYSFHWKMAGMLGLNQELIKDNQLAPDEAHKLGIPLDTSLDTTKARRMLTRSFRQTSR